MTTVMNCATGTMAPFQPNVDKPWNQQRVLHLFRRMGYSASPVQVEDALALSPSELVDNLVDEAVALPLFDEPFWAYWTAQDYDNFQDQAPEQIFQWTMTWLNGMLDNGFRDKLTLFWHNHFVTQLNTYFCPSYLYQYHKILQQYGLGDFKQFVYEVGKTPAMLFFLNGAQSTAANPNENYARELYELFTLGQDNGYTQMDIEETARALTGWNPQLDLNGECGPINFVPVHWDGEAKTIFGQTGLWGYDDVHDILFDQRPNQIASHICGKIYSAFVNPCVDEDMVAEMATIFKENDFQLAPVFKALFKSEHFFDENNFGVIVKSPVEHFFTILKETEMPYNVDLLHEILYFCAVLGQEIWYPIDVAGWPGDKSWINSNNLTGRWGAMGWLVNVIVEFQPELLRDFAKILTNNSNDPVLITATIVDYFTSTGLQTQTDYDIATVVFKYDVPQNYYDDGIWNLDWQSAPIQVAELMKHIARQPEFQLL